MVTLFPRLASEILPKVETCGICWLSFERTIHILGIYGPGS